MAYDVRALIEQLSCEGLFVDVEGCSAFLITPAGKTASSPSPWVWYAPTKLADHPSPDHAWMFGQFLEAGFAIAGVDVGESYGNPQGRAVYTVFYETLCAQYGLSERACLFPQSRGGLMLYNWAAEHARCVACIAGMFPVADLRSYPGLETACGAYGMSEEELAACLPEHNPVVRLAPLAKAGVPILHLHGDSDTVVPIEQNSGELAERYRKLGGKMELLIVPGKGHGIMPEFFQCQALVDFVIRHAG